MEEESDVSMEQQGNDNLHATDENNKNNEATEVFGDNENIDASG